MKLILVNFKEGERTEVEEQYDPKALDLEFVDLKYLSPLQMKGYVEKGSDTLFFGAFSPAKPSIFAAVA